MEAIEIDLANRKGVREFIDMPFQLYKEDPLWVPPLISEVMDTMNLRKHPFYRDSEAGFFVVRGEDGDMAGRIAVINSRRYNELSSTRTAFFYYFECVNDLRISQALFDSAFKWAGKHGLNKMLGPRGFSPLDGRGILVDGFEYRPAFGITYNPAYYQKLIEAAGFKMQREFLSGYIRRETAVLPEAVLELADRVAQRRGLRIVKFKDRRDLGRVLFYLKDLYNASLGSERDNIPLDDEEARKVSGMLRQIADPDLIKLVMKEDRVVGFLLAYPDISAALQKIKGRLFPFGWITLKRELKRTEWVNLNGIGMLEEYRGLGGMAILASEISKTLSSKKQYKIADFVQIAADNEIMQREIARFGVDFCKRHYVYIKDISQI